MSYVLVVEDNDLDFERIQRLAAKLGLAVELRWAGDGLEAMNMLRASDELPIGLIVDLNMPRMGGWELVAAIRADPRLEPLPVSVCTTSAHPSDLLAAREAEVSSYVVKPIEKDELRIILNGLQSKSLSRRAGDAAPAADDAEPVDGTEAAAVDEGALQVGTAGSDAAPGA